MWFYGLWFYGVWLGFGFRVNKQVVDAAVVDAETDTESEPIETLGWRWGALEFMVSGLGFSPITSHQ